MRLRQSQRNTVRMHTNIDIFRLDLSDRNSKNETDRDIEADRIKAGDVQR